MDEVTVEEPQDDERLTAFGLLVETSTALLDRVGRQLEAQGSSITEFGTMLRLSRSPGHRLRMADLASQSGLSASGLTRLVDRLAMTGLATREPCADDRRGSFATLTDAVLARITGLLPGHLELVQQQFTGVLDAKEAAQLDAILRKLRAVVFPGAEAGADEPVAHSAR